MIPYRMPDIHIITKIADDARIAQIRCIEVETGLFILLAIATLQAILVFEKIFHLFDGSDP